MVGGLGAAGSTWGGVEAEMAKDKDEVPGLSDEEWAEFERSFTTESTETASYKEPSARQRELTARWKKEPPKDTGWRTDGPNADLRPRDRVGSVVETAPVRKRARWKRPLVWVLIVLLIIGAIAGLPALFTSDKSTNMQQPGSGPSDLAADSSASPGQVWVTAPPLDPSRQARVDRPWSAITPAKAYPATVKGASGDTYTLVTTQTAAHCADMMSSDIAALVSQGSGCQQMMAGLYTDSQKKGQYTILVLTMKRAEDAGAIFSMVRVMNYQFLSLDPPPGSGLSPIPHSAPGTMDDIMAVRSVITANAQYSDGGDHGVDALNAKADEVLKAVDDAVAAYETAASS
jgi:hypothetical protein